MCNLRLHVFYNARIYNPPKFFCSVRPSHDLFPLFSSFIRSLDLCLCRSISISISRSLARSLYLALSLAHSSSISLSIYPSNCDSIHPSIPPPSPPPSPPPPTFVSFLALSTYSTPYHSLPFVRSLIFSFTPLFTTPFSRYSVALALFPLFTHTPSAKSGWRRRRRPRVGPHDGGGAGGDPEAARGRDAGSASPSVMSSCDSCHYRVAFWFARGSHSGSALA